MTNIRDVARLANASVASVSNVFNTPDRVSATLRARIGKVAAELGYAPNPAARSLRKGCSNLIGLIVADITNPFFTELVDVIERAASRLGYSVLLCNSAEDPAREQNHLDVLRAQRIDGLIMAPTGRPSRTIARSLATLRFPVVLIDRALDELGFDTVSLDNQMAASSAVLHALDQGHRRIGFINGSVRLRTAAHRLSGYRDALLSRGVPVDPAMIREAAFRERDAYEAAVALMSNKLPPTAVFAANNLMTIGLLRALSDLGLRCPEQVSVIGMDDFPWAEAFTPPLTAVAQPVGPMGEAALRLVLGRIGGRCDGPPEHVVETPRLVIRGSCKPKPAMSANHAGPPWCANTSGGPNNRGAKGAISER